MPRAARLPPSFEFSLDREWRITSISEGAAAWSGSTPHDLVGRDSREVWPPEPESLTRAIEAAFAHRESSTLEEPSLVVPGRWLKVDVEPSKDGARVRFNDITARIGLGGGPAEIVVLDRGGVIVAANAAWRVGAVLLGLNLADAGVGASYVTVAKTLVPRTDEVALRGRLEELFSGRLSEFEATYSQGGDEHLERRQVRIMPLQGDHTAYFLAVHESLTERARILAMPHRTSDQQPPERKKERDRIAVELCDLVGQNQAAMLLGLESLRKRLDQDAVARAVLNDMSKLVDENIRHTRALSYLANGSANESAGLDGSLRRFVTSFAPRAGLDVTFNTQGPLEGVGPAAQHAILRIVQEALSNVYRHARAKQVSVNLASRNGMLTICVSDDGRGFQPAAAAPDAGLPLAVGIVGMRARLEQLGGKLEIVGGASGTTVTASLPLQLERSV